MRNTTDFLIIGGGVIGASIGFYLSNKRPGRIVLCEQSMPPGDGATRRSGGIIRMHHTNPFQTKLAWDSYETFACWSEIVGGDCGFRKTGFTLFVGPEYIEPLRNNVKMMESLGIPVEIYTNGKWRELNPYISDAEIGAAAYEPLSGYANPQLATLGFLRRAQENGLELMEGVKISHLIVKGDRAVGVSTNIGDIYADKIILAANVWCVELLRKVNISVPIHSKRIAICFLRYDLPKLTACIDDTIGTYFRPTENNEILVGITTDEKNVDPSTISPLSIKDFRWGFERIVRRIPVLQNAEWVGGRVAFDAYTPDKHAIIGEIKQLEGIYLALGFSGGGFKVAPAVGKAIAEELTSQTHCDELEPYRFTRFEEGKLIRGFYQYYHM